MTYEWLTRLTDLVFLVAGGLLGAWIYHRGQLQKPPLPQHLPPMSFRVKPKGKSKEEIESELPQVGV